LIPLALVEKAMKRTDIEAVGPKIMGIDPAEYGDDDTVMGYGRVGWCTAVRRYHKKGPMEVVGLAARAIESGSRTSSTWTPAASGQGSPTAWLSSAIR
jgi:hypothetical protein